MIHRSGRQMCPDHAIERVRGGAECSSGVAGMLADFISIGSWSCDAGRTRCQASKV